MSLNKFTDIEKGKLLGLQIGCETLECTNCVCESMTFPSGGDLNAHDVNVSNNLKVATSNGDVNYTTPDKGQPNYSLHTDGAGNTFWSPDDTGSADLTYNGTIPVALGQHVKFSNTDTSTVNESKLIEDATDLNVQGLNLTNVGLINGAVFPDITDLNSKTQNISLADTVPNTTVLSGRVLSDTMFYDDASENAIFTSGVGGLVPANFRHTSFGVGAGITADLSCNFGYQAGQTNQGSTSVAIGVQAGQNSQGNQCVAIGEGSGKTNQGNKCVSVGDGSGSSNQGANSIAIGYNAGGSFQPADSIILNATGGTTNNTATNQIRMKAGTTDLIAEGNDLSLGGVNLTNKLNNVESKTQNIDLSGTVPNTTQLNGGLQVATINNLTPAAGSFAQTSSVVIVNTTTESTILGTGEGSLSVPPNKFRLGGSYRISAGGVMSCLNNTDLTIRLYGGATGSTLLGTIPTLTIPTSTGKWWGLECYFTIRALGGANTAVFSFRAKYEQNVDSQNGLIGQSIHSIESTNFDTTILNILNITAQWGTASTSNTFTTTQCVLYVIW